MPQSRAQRSRDPGLIWIEFPGMEINNCGLPLLFINLPDRISSDSIGQQSQIPTACYPEIIVCSSYCGRGEFKYTIPPVRKPLGVRDPIKVMPDGKDGGIDFEAFFSEDVQGPKCRLCDGEAGCPVAFNRFLCLIHQALAGFAHILPELLDILSLNMLVSVAVAADLVSGISDLPDHMREKIRNTAQYKEGCLRVVIGEDFQNQADVSFNPRFKSVPIT